MGPPYQLHEYAKNWVKKVLNYSKNQLFQGNEIFYEVTKQEKIRRIATLECDVFIDDLPEILSQPGYPQHTKKILFDPDSIHHCMGSEVVRASSWQDITKLLLI